MNPKYIVLLAFSFLCFLELEAPGSDTFSSRTKDGVFELSFQSDTAGEQFAIKVLFNGADQTGVIEALNKRPALASAFSSDSMRIEWTKTELKTAFSQESKSQSGTTASSDSRSQPFAPHFEHRLGQISIKYDSENTRLVLEIEYGSTSGKQLWSMKTGGGDETTWSYTKQ